MGAVRQLNFEERVHIDGTFLGEVVVQLGPEAGEALIHDALGTLALEVEEVAGHCAAVAAGGTGRLADLVRCCDRLSRMAWEMGLTTLSGTAIDLGLCAERGDLCALSAVGARLQRVGQMSLAQAMAEAAFG